MKTGEDIRRKRVIAKNNISAKTELCLRADPLPRFTVSGEREGTT